MIIYQFPSSRLLSSCWLQRRPLLVLVVHFNVLQEAWEGGGRRDGSVMDEGLRRPRWDSPRLERERGAWSRGRERESAGSSRPPSQPSEGGCAPLGPAPCLCLQHPSLCQPAAADGLRLRAAGQAEPSGCVCAAFRMKGVFVFLFLVGACAVGHVGPQPPDQGLTWAPCSDSAES